MARVRRDHEMGQLPPAEYARVIETTRAVLDRAIAAGPTPAREAPGAEAPEPVVVAGCPVRDGAARVVLPTLRRVIESGGARVQHLQAASYVVESGAPV